MVELACAGEPRFVASRLEAGRQVSYSILTIEKLRTERPGAELFFVIGADAFAEIQTWKRWQELMTLTSFIVAGRPGAKYAVPVGATVYRLDMEMDISSSRIRRILAEGAQDLPLPHAVEEYISEHHLYSVHNSLE